MLGLAAQRCFSTPQSQELEWSRRIRRPRVPAPEIQGVWVPCLQDDLCQVLKLLVFYRPLPKLD